MGTFIYRSGNRNIGAVLMDQNFLLALIFGISTMTLFAIVLLRQIGGSEALFLILGHIAAWAEMIVIFYFRKKPPKGGTESGVPKG